MKVIQSILLPVFLFCVLLFGCTKKDNNDNPRDAKKLEITDFYPKKAADGDTITFTGNFPEDYLGEIEVRFAAKDFTTDGSMRIAKAFAASATKFSVVVPDFNELSSKPFSCYTVVQIMPYNSTVYYRGQPDSLLTFKPRIKSVRIQPMAARQGQTVTLFYNNMDIDLSSLKVKFQGVDEWQTPIAYDSFYHSQLWYKGPVIRIPEGAATGTIQIVTDDRSSVTSDSILTVLPLMPRAQQGTWTRIADFAARSANDDNIIENGRTGTIAFTINDKVYMGCGASLAPFDEFGSMEMWEYDPKYNSWVQIAGFPGGNRTYAVAFSINGKGYVGTGLDKNGQPTKDFWQYDPVSNSWTRIADFPGAPRSNAVGFAVNDEGFVGTGIGAQDVYDDIYRYNPVSNTWTQSPSMAVKRTEAYAFVIGNTAYIGGGHNRNSIMSDLQSFTPGVGTWVQKASIPNYIYLSANASFVVSGKAYVGLGRDKRQQGVFGYTQVFEYTPSTDSWRALPNLNKERSYSIGFSVKDIGYMGMGTPIGGLSALEDIWAYKP